MKRDYHCNRVQCLRERYQYRAHKLVAHHPSESVRVDLPVLPIPAFLELWMLRSSSVEMALQLGLIGSLLSRLRYGYGTCFPLLTPRARKQKQPATQTPIRPRFTPLYYTRR